MIFYFVRRDFGKTMRAYLASWGRELSASVEILPYDIVLDLPTPLAAEGVYIFSDLERLSPKESEKAARYWKALQESGLGVHLLNHPTRCRRRYELLRMLHRSGTSDVEILRVTDGTMPTRYPVFLKKENDHTVALSNLLYDRSELHKAIDDLDRQGISRDDTVVIEFVDTADAHGVYRKYSAFRIGDAVIPRHLFCSKNWMVKHPELFEDRLVEEERQYVRTNPHAREIRSIFEQARIDYGRIDYGMRNGKIHVWEINTNPNIATDRDGGGEMRRPLQERFAEQFNAALLALECQLPRRLRTRGASSWASWIRRNKEGTVRRRADR